jgi:hypothetical protein
VRFPDVEQKMPGATATEVGLVNVAVVVGVN